MSTPPRPSPPPSRPPTPCTFTNLRLITSSTTLQLGSYLGGGAAGVVYEAITITTTNTNSSSLPSFSKYAVKILTPIPYRLLPPTRLATMLPRGAPGTPTWWNPIPTMPHIIFLQRPDCKDDIIACNMTNPTSPVELTLAELFHLLPQLTATRLPTKLTTVLSARNKILTETHMMRACSGHPNVLTLVDVLEQIEDTKLTLFLVLELATGGELFDRIQLDMGLDEPLARHYFGQLLAGVRHCHDCGVSHRDLKPENLLLSDCDVLKIADFGFSRATTNEIDDTFTPLDRVTSVVGSPHYIAPEVLNAPINGAYDAKLADSWSCGVVLFAMLAGKLPFGRDLQTCHMFQKWKLISHNLNLSDAELNSMSMDEIDFSQDFFPEHLSNEVVELMAGLLDPNPSTRLSIRAAGGHRWFGMMPVKHHHNVVSVPVPTRPKPSLPNSDGMCGSSTSNRGLSFQSPPLAPLHFLIDDDEYDTANMSSTFSLLDLAGGHILPSSSSPPVPPDSIANGSKSCFAPEFNTDVRRSTRFTTTRVPPSEILNLVEMEINNVPGLTARYDDPFTLLVYDSNNSANGQEEDEEREVCVVKVYLMMRNASSCGATYLVEFVRSSETSIFELKRLFVDVREKLVRLVRSGDFVA